MSNIAILASHNGSTFNTVYRAIQKQELDANIALLISNNTNSLALQNAKEYGINNFLKKINMIKYINSYNKTTVSMYFYLVI